jgi:hypothetical protein
LVAINGVPVDTAHSPAAIRSPCSHRLLNF